ncbi:hypothetical protein, conserved [Leishmania tarentolae]|uniref:Uncharacterized protein n=1 Tax=Leishmania tarentolae TaxID=5689 RepID=A0A640K795_LEITA|nr:hypothetical protein, conserved [Leishmania tarentolae]
MAPGVALSPPPPLPAHSSSLSHRSASSSRTSLSLCRLAQKYPLAPPPQALKTLLWTHWCGDRDVHNAYTHRPHRRPYGRRTPHRQQRPPIAASTGSTSSASSASSASMHQLPEASTRGTSGVPEGATRVATNSSGSGGSVVHAHHEVSKGGAFAARPTTPRSSGHRSEHGACVDTEGSDTAAGTINTATMATAASVARRTTAAPSFSDHTLSQLPRQQRRIRSSTATPPGSVHTSQHSDEDIARVRAALAEVGYPNPSWEGIERVFAQLAVTQDNGDRSAASKHRATTPTQSATHTSRRDVQGETVEEGHEAAYYHRTRGATITPPPVSPPPQQEDNPTESSNLLQHLEPSLRLQRYIRLRERELEQLCLRPSFGTFHAQQEPPPPQQQQQWAPVSPAVHASETLQGHSHDAPHASKGKASSFQGASSEKTGKQQQQRRRGSAAVAPRTRGKGDGVDAGAAASGDAQVTAMAAHHRRAANIIFDATGDQRFRFFPSTRTPPGTGTLVTVAHAPRTSSSSTSTTLLTGAVPATRLGSYHNYYQCRRPNSCSTVGGQVSYLDPEGRTVRRKADPVKRGEQMRLLWAKDSFLSQRHRPREAWRTRQITMAYGQGADGSETHYDS